MSLTFVSHLNRLVGGVVVDEDSRGIVGSSLQDLLFKGAVPSLQQRHPVDAPRGNQEASVWVAALSVHHCGDTRYCGKCINDGFITTITQHKIDNYIITD